MSSLDPSIAIDASGVETIEYVELPRAATWSLGERPLLSIGVDAGEEPYMFTDIGDVQLLPDGSFLVAERRAPEVRVFDAAGGFLHAIGREGQGPGEFEYLAVMALHRDKLLAWDAAGRLSSFTTAGKLVSTVRTNNIGGNPNSIVQGVFGDGSLLVALAEIDFPSGPNLIQVDEVLVRWSPGDDPDEFVTFTTVHSGQNWLSDDRSSSWWVPFSAAADRSAGADALYVSPAGTFEFQRYRLDGTLERVVRINEPAEPITADFIERYIDTRVERYDEPRQQTLRATYSSMTFPELFPRVDDLDVDREQRVWLRRHRIDPEEDQVLHVFDSDGMLAGTVHLPASLEYRLATRDRLIGVWRDEMDVQSLRVYELQRD